MNQRELQREETKKRIYECAFELFMEKDFSDVKVQDIAKKAGVSVGSVYYHYRSKEEIIDYGYFAFDQQLKEFYESSAPQSGINGIHALLSYQIYTCIKRTSRVIAITFKNQINSENSYLYSKDRYLYRLLVENLEAAGVRRKTPEEAANMLLCATRGCVYDWCCHQGAYDLHEMAARELEPFYEYLGI